MKNKFLIYLLVIFVILVSISLISLWSINYQFIKNDNKISQVNSPQQLVEVIISANKSKDSKTLEFFHCRVTSKDQEQVDFDQYLGYYIDGTKKFDWSNTKIRQLESNKIEISNLKRLEESETISDILEVNKQQPDFWELKTKESYCFLSKANSPVIKAGQENR